MKYFRAIRQKLVSDNKTGKYLKYAIGEIFLVVIGILIALQINNWNEGRKNQKLRIVYKKSLIDNLVQDSVDIHDKIEKIKSDRLEIKAFEQRVADSQSPLDTILKIARFEYNFSIVNKYHYEKDTYEVLNTTGHIALFDNELIKKLKELNILQDRALSDNTHTFESYRNNGNNYARKFPLSFGLNIISDNTKIASEVWNNISKEEHATTFNALIISKGDAYRLSLKNLPELSNKTNELLDRLRKQK